MKLIYKKLFWASFCLAMCSSGNASENSWDSYLATHPSDDISDAESISLESDQQTLIRLLPQLLDDTDEHERTAVLQVINYGSEKNAIAMIGKLPNINAYKGHRGRSLLHLAIPRKQYLTIYSLIKNGANVNATDDNGETPLHVAITYGFFEIAESLIKAGAQLNVLNSRGESPLYKSIFWKHWEIFNLLLSEGASWDQNIFALAARQGNLDIVEQCLESELDINGLNNRGNTPLIEAIMGDKVNQNEGKVVEFLVQRGADINLINANGMSPLDMAYEFHNQNLIEFFEKHGTERNLEIFLF